jgi:oxalate---CoA ligase
LSHQTEHNPDAIAILAYERAPLTYADLHRHVGDVGKTLRAMGIHRNDRVALVVPDGPEMAVSFLAVAASATCVSLNPAYSADEFAAYLADFQVKVLVVQAGLPSPAEIVAHTCGLSVVELVPRLEVEAGIFSLPAVAQKTAGPMSLRPAMMWH